MKVNMAKEIEADHIVLREVLQDNMEQYFYVKQKASLFSRAYEDMEDIWLAMEAELRKSAFDGSPRMLIYGKNDKVLYGYVEAEKDNDNLVGINIGVLERFRNRGIATEAAKAFVEYVFVAMNVDQITWNAFLSNKASCRVAEKIGGIESGNSSIVFDAMKMAGFTIDNMKDNNLLQEVCYVIRKRQI